MIDAQELALLDTKVTNLPAQAVNAIVSGLATWDRVLNRSEIGTALAALANGQVVLATGGSSNRDDWYLASEFWLNVGYALGLVDVDGSGDLPHGAPPSDRTRMLELTHKFQTQ